jgi:diaminopimelate decarboxylase
MVEPGRSVVGPAGVLLTNVVYTKTQGREQFAICDAGMNDLLRPALYNAHHPIQPVRASTAPSSPWHVVGPVCETGDTLARARALPPLQRGDLLAVTHAGAYGFSMSSNYNGRRRPAEVLVDGDQVTLIRRRQQWEALLDGCPPIRRI